MNDLKIFENVEFGQIRTVTFDDGIHFVGKDVATALGFTNSRDAIATHVFEDDKGVEIIDTLGGKQKMTIINESGLYALVFGSRLESAKRFKHWVTSEVLPALRKTGTYQMNNMSTELKAILMHDEKIVNIENRMDKLEYDIPLYGSEADELSSHVRRRGVTILGGKKSNAYQESNIRSKVYRDIYEQIKREFGLYGEDGKAKSYKALKRKYLFDAHEVVDAYEPPMYLYEMIRESNAQLSMAV